MAAPTTPAPDDVRPEYGSGSLPPPHQATNLNPQLQRAAPPGPPIHPNPAYPTGTLPRRAKPRTRTNVLLATLNMNGRASPSLGPGPLSKWTTIQRLIRQRKIGILCLQETHLTTDHVTQLNHLFGRRLIIVCSHPAENPTASAGTAFIINRELLNPSRTHHTEHIPGRASTLSITWAADHTLTITNIYAPNSPNAHATFWDTIQGSLRTNSLRPDILLGDFNIVEDALDRSPQHPDYAPAVETLRILRESINVQDTWRHDNPNTRSYTFSSNAHSFSRIDRIYTKPSISRQLHDWSTEIPNVPTDHKLVLVRYTPPHLPYMGKGRWTWPLGLAHNQSLLQKISEQGKDLQAALENQAPPSHPQRLWATFKKSIAEHARKETRTQLPKIANRIAALQQDANTLCNTNEDDITPDARRNIAMIETEIRHLTNKQNKTELARSQAKWQDKGESINKYWMATQATRRPRDLIHALDNPRTERRSTKTSEMATIAGTYHDNLQRLDLLAPDDPERRDAQTAVLNGIPPEQHFADPTSPLNELITERQVHQAIRASKNGTATGLDGIPYEVWKAIIEYNAKLERVRRPYFDLIKCLLVVYNDIQLNGMDQTTGFSNGWMCPIYKKKDRSRIENYRPITLLNTDYKIFTKILATQLAAHACQLLHPNQTGFVPHRSVFDPIRLAASMCEYADYMEENGAIVALDQEKAYDKIDHQYMFDTLRTFKLPDLFIRTVESIYSNAHTQVAINGVFSDPYKVTRGVRQGDPLSCLLFNLATIEPLAASLRNSPDLSGFNIPGAQQKVIVNLYADDTTVFLSESDKYDTVRSLLSQWCKASGAKFNIEKTEILVPIGTPEHRERVLHTRQIHPTDQPLPETIKIAPDGQPIRVLGAWIGNQVDNAQPWSATIDKIKNSLDLWSKARPTLDAKRLIIQLTVGGMTQFLTKAQSMPPTVLKTLNRLTREFIWGGKNPPISLDCLCAPKTDGGISPSLLDLAARNLAIETTWLKAYLDLSPARPTWAFVTDAIINCIKPSGIQTSSDINIFLTSIRPSTRSSRNRRRPPMHVSRLLQTASKVNLSLAPIKLSKNLQCQLPAWYHVGVPPHLSRLTAASCLRTTHRVKTIKNLLKVSKRLFRHDSDHNPHGGCMCKYCRRDRNKGCTNPHKCSRLARDIIGDMTPKYSPYIRPEKDHLSLTHRRKEKNARAVVTAGDEILFDPSVTTRKDISDGFRILVDPSRTDTEPAYRLHNPRIGGLPQQPDLIYTDGSCLKNGKMDASAGAGIWVREGHHLNAAIRVPGASQTNQTGEIAAIVAALVDADPLVPLKFITDSKYVIDGLTKHLSTWEDNGWTMIKNTEWFQAAAYRLRYRAAPTIFQWTKGHAGDPGNEAADRLANDGAHKIDPDPIDLRVPPAFDVPGLKLRTLTQHIAYLALTSKPPTLTNSAQRNLDTTRYAIQALTGHLELNSTLWTTTRHPDIRRPVQSFLYRALHNSLRIGRFWAHIPNYQHRADCQRCIDTTEDLEHILLHCSSPECTTLWDLAKALWPPSHGEWPPITMGTILGCGAITPPTPTDRPRPSSAARGKARLLRILISETAHLIWAIRCGRVISEQTLTPAAVTTRWLTKLNDRLSIDRRLARLPHRPNMPNRVQHTWQPVLAGIDPNIPQHWVTNPEVLVGITLSRPSV